LYHFCNKNVESKLSPKDKLKVDVLILLPETPVLSERRDLIDEGIGPSGNMLCLRFFFMV
jgi:hypothetical protein